MTERDEIQRQMSEALGRVFDRSAEIDTANPSAMTDAPPVKFKKNSVAIQVSREMLLDMGIVEPTPEEKAERDERMRLFITERNKRTLIREAAWAQLRLVKEPAVKAVLELHAMVDKPHGDPECAHCYWDTEMGDHEDWPCETVTAIANAYGIEMP